MKLGSGICPVPTLLDAGVNVALGTDGMSSNDGNDMYATLKIAGLLHKLWEIDYEEWLGRAGGLDDGHASAAPVRRAMRTVSDASRRGGGPTSCSSTSTRSRSHRSTTRCTRRVFGSTTLAVDSTMIGGRWVVRDGAVTGPRRGRDPRRGARDRRGDARPSRCGLRDRRSAARIPPRRLARRHAHRRRYRAEAAPLTRSPFGEHM